MSGGGGTRVSIPNNLRKLIQEMKKTLGSKYRDEFVYATLKDSDMDPDEAGRRLKMIHDTFHEVKKKNDRRKTISNDTSEEYKRTRGDQWRRAKGGRGTFYSSNGFDDVGGGRHMSSGKEYGVTNRQERVLKPAGPVHSGKENNIAHVATSAVNVNGTPATPNEYCSYKLAAPEVSADVSSSCSDPVVVPSNQTCAVGTIQCEIVKRSISSESIAKLPVGVKFCADKAVASTLPVIAEDADYNDTIQPKSDVVEKTPAFESLMPISLSTQNSSQFVNPNQDNHSQLFNEPLKVTASEHITGSMASALPVPGEESQLKQSALKLDEGLEKLTLSPHQSVIFPDHVLVPDNFASQFTFGSLNHTHDDCNVNESTQQNGEAVTEPPSSSQNVPTTAEEGEFKDRSLPHPSEHVLSSLDNTSSDPALKHEQKKMEMILPVGGFQHQFLQNTWDYTFGYMPHLMAPHFVHVDVPELQGGGSLMASASGPTQPATATQSSVAIFPPLFPYFRQPYPNYIPYNPYFPHMFLPQNAHLFNHGVFSQQPPTGNIEMQPAMKFPVPSQYKQASLEVTPGTRSSANEDLTVSQSKENGLHSAA